MSARLNPALTLPGHAPLLRGCQTLLEVPGISHQPSKVSEPLILPGRGEVRGRRQEPRAESPGPAPRGTDQGSLSWGWCAAQRSSAKLHARVWLCCSRPHGGRGGRLTTRPAEGSHVPLNCRTPKLPLASSVSDSEAASCLKASTQQGIL